MRINTRQSHPGSTSHLDTINGAFQNVSFLLSAQAATKYTEGREEAEYNMIRETVVS